MVKFFLAFCDYGTPKNKNNIVVHTQFYADHIQIIFSNKQPIHTGHFYFTGQNSSFCIPGVF